MPLFYTYLLHHIQGCFIGKFQRVQLLIVENTQREVSFEDVDVTDRQVAAVLHRFLVNLEGIFLALFLLKTGGYVS
jgi:hypothetical protein